MKKQLTSIFTAVAFSLTLMPGAAFAEEDGGKPECTCEWLCGGTAEECPVCTEDAALCEGRAPGAAPQAENGGDITSKGLHFQPSFYLDVPLVETVYTAGEGTVTWIPTVSDGVITDGLVIFDNTTFDLSGEGVPEYFDSAPCALSYQEGGYLTGDLEIRLIGENRVTAHHKMSNAITAGAGSSPAVLETTIKGIDGGSLIFTNTATDSCYYTGISSPQMVIEDAEITLQKGIIQTLNSITIQRSEIDVTIGGEGALSDYAIDCSAGDVLICDSNVKIDSNGYGIAARTVTIEDTEAAIRGDTMALGGVIEITDSNVIAVGGTKKVSSATIHSGGLWNEGPDDIEASGALVVSPEESAKPLAVAENSTLAIQNDAAFDITLKENAALTAANAKSLTAEGAAKILLNDGTGSLIVSGSITADSGSFTLEYDGDAPEERAVLTAQSPEDAEKIAFDETKFERADSQIIWKQEQLAAPDGLIWSGAKAQWNALPGAAGYAVQLYKDGAVYGDVVLVETCEHDFAAQIVADGSYSFCVKALGDGVRYLDGEYCENSGNYRYTVPVSAFAIAVTAGRGGTARADRTSAEPGDMVTLFYTADNGYRFDHWTIRSGEIEITGNSFQMPGEDVAIQAEFVPTGSSGSSPSGGGSGRGSASSQRLPVRTDTIAVSGSLTAETVAKPSASISGTTASVQVSENIAGEILRQASQNNSRIVVIMPDVKGTVSKTEVSIPAYALKSLGEQTKANLTVSTPTVVVSIENGGLGSLADMGGIITVAMEKRGDTVKFSVLADGQELKTVSGGVTLAVPYEMCRPGIVAVLQQKDGTSTVVPKSLADHRTMMVAIPLDGSAELELADKAIKFEDMPDGHWAAGAAAFASARGLLNGTGDRCFSPDGLMTRGMLAKVLYNLEGGPSVVYREEFRDVTAEDWYAEGVLWAADRGIAGGYGNGEFGAMDSITREQLAVMLWKYAGCPETKGVLRFDDADEASAYAREALCWAAESGVMNGREAGRLAPKALATRAEAAQMLWNFMMR